MSLWIGTTSFRSGSEPNAEKAWRRRAEIINEWEKSTLYGGGGGDLFDWGGQARLARRFGVSPATISHDLRKIREENGRSPCPTCDGAVSVERWKRLERAGRVRIKTDKPKAYPGHQPPVATK